MKFFNFLKMNKKIVVVIAAAFFLMMGCGGMSDFTSDEWGYYGEVELLGYVNVEEVPEVWCFDEDCKMYMYAQFEILEASDEDIYAMIERKQGNSFFGENNVGLGCITDGIIEYANHSDEFGYQEIELSAEDSAVLLNSTAQNPITIKLEKMPLSGGKGAPTCYSHFTKIDLL